MDRPGFRGWNPENRFWNYT